MPDAGVLTAEELALLPERARYIHDVAIATGHEWNLYLCYELALAKQEIKRLELEALRDESQS